MSRTDKDVPYRVHLARTGRAKHDHRFGPCDLEDWTPERYWLIRQRGTSCRRVEGNNYWSDTLRLFPRTRRVDAVRRRDYSSERTDLRRAATAARKAWNGGGDMDADELEIRRPCHRHNALWEAW